MSEPLRIEFTALASQHVREAEEWWRLNRLAAPNAVREELQQLLPLSAVQPRMGSQATNVKLEFVVFTFAVSGTTCIFMSSACRN